ncbi:hypothetical protein FACS1894110_26290 [Spirochaetia bacterium]|nr:hypothetical protein FACS1894110_26290 [Spirochaetia bacterium]
MNVGKEMYTLAEKLFPICRSITGNGVRETLGILKSMCPELNIFEVPSGTQVFDWTIPKEWNINDAYIKDIKGEKILDFSDSNLQVIGYSVPVHKKIKKEELLQYIYTEPDKPDVIPYVTSYYKERYGFCMTENQRLKIIADYDADAEFEIFIDSTLSDGFLTFGDIFFSPPPPLQYLIFYSRVIHYLLVFLQYPIMQKTVPLKYY